MRPLWDANKRKARNKVLQAPFFYFDNFSCASGICSYSAEKIANMVKMTQSLYFKPQNSPDFISQSNPKKRWIIYSVAFSLTLHVGITSAIIIASGLQAEVTNVNRFVLQDIVITPSITAPTKEPQEPPDLASAIKPDDKAIFNDNSKPNQKLQQKEQAETGPTTVSSEIARTASLGLGMANGYFSGIADGKTLRDDIRSYYFDMVAKINQNWWNNAGILKNPLRQDGILELLTQRDGTIISVRILQGTGSLEADQLLIKTVKDASPISPLPSSYEPDLFRAPLKIKAPSFLLRLK